MLIRLDISNYALIENVNLQLKGGFTAITGETGAGKSILLKALHLLLGDRADTAVLRQSANKCYLEAEFDISQLNLEDYFQTNELEFENHTIIRREFTSSGKSRCFVNDSPVQQSQLKALGELLISVHNQHQASELLNIDFQLDILDHFCGLEAQSSAYRKKYRRYKLKINELYELKEKDREARKEQDYFEFLLNELKEAQLDKTDLDALQKKTEQIQNAGKIADLLGMASAALEDETYGPQPGIKTVIEALDGLKSFDSKFADLHARMLSLKIELRDIAEEVQHHADSFEFSDEEAEQVREKMDLVNNLLYKHHLQTIEELVQLQHKLESDLENISSLELQIQSLTVEIEQMGIELNQEAASLREVRTKKAPEFTDRVAQIMGELAMPNAELEIRFAPLDQIGPNGADQIEFQFKTNLGGSFLPIRKIASGGELSRLTLAVLTILSETKSLPTLIFDEIDTGVSGEVAARIAASFEKMGQKIQLLAITHLPQVAGRADHHFHVFKADQESKTVTSVQYLNDKERIDELAKMISGESVTAAARENAVHLLKNS